MLPIAYTLFKEVDILGCDGRKIEDNDYFWTHDKASQFVDEMDGIKTAHPAFFDIDYDDYYSTHCEILEIWLSIADKLGIRVRNLTPSYIPALQKRSITSIQSTAT